MRTRVIPAQITTVEDKIVGNLNLMQMAILMVPIFFYYPDLCTSAPINEFCGL